MGACCGQQSNPSKKNRSALYKQTGATEKATYGGPAPGSNSSFNPVKYDHVIANQGNVEKEYELITPPLGQGAFGEVRKAIHKSSGLERAVKIIYKDKSDPVELAKIKDEVSLIFV
jgi:calcium-dependent protein kinase